MIRHNLYIYMRSARLFTRYYTIIKCNKIKAIRPLMVFIIMIIFLIDSREREREREWFIIIESGA